MRVCLASLLLLFTATSFADGKFYSDRIPPDIPYQRAIIGHDGTKQVLLLESKLEAREGERFGWVVPVPAVPEIAAPDADSINSLYSMLESRTKPIVISIVEAAFFATLALIICRWLYRLYQGLRYRRQIGRPLETLVTLAFLGVFAMIALPAYQGIDVLKEERVGPYDAKVIRGNSAGELIAWLKENGFAFDDRDRAAIDAYILRKWVFVTAKLDSGAMGARGKMVPPLFLLFESRHAVYPLALTGTNGRTTEILLYVFASARMDDGGRLPFRFAGDSVQAPRFVTTPLTFAGSVYVTKFRGQLAPEQMRTDLVFKPATTNAPYRPWEFKP